MDVRSDQKSCFVCQTIKPVEQFKTQLTRGVYYVRNICKRCHNQKCTQRAKIRGINRAKADRRNEVLRSSRAMTSNAPRWILQDSRKNDKKKGYENDLTKEFIDGMIRNGCTYCDEDSIRMTLDRIDNTVGHIQSNVVPACIRCNYIRRDMPYLAWLEFSPSLKEARKKGLFEGWTGAWKTGVSPSGMARVLGA